MKKIKLLLNFLTSLKQNWSELHETEDLEWKSKSDSSEENLSDPTSEKFNLLFLKLMIFIGTIIEVTLRIMSYIGDL